MFITCLDYKVSGLADCNLRIWDTFHPMGQMPIIIFSALLEKLLSVDFIIGIWFVSPGQVREMIEWKLLVLMLLSKRLDSI